MIPFKLLALPKAMAVVAPPTSQNVSATYTAGDANMTLVLSAASSYTSIQSFRIVSVPATGVLKLGATALSAGVVVGATGNSVTLTYEPTGPDAYGTLSGQFVAIDSEGLESDTFTYQYVINQAPRPATVSPTWQYGYAGVGNTIVHPISATPYNAQPQNAIAGFKIVTLPDTAYGNLTDMDGNVLSVGSIVPAVGNSASVKYTQTVETVTTGLGGTFTAISVAGYEDLTPANFAFYWRNPRPVADVGYFYGTEGQTSFTTGADYESEYPVDYVVLTMTQGLLDKGTFQFTHNGVPFQPGDQLEIDRTSGTNRFIIENIGVEVTWVNPDDNGVLGTLYLTATDTLGRTGPAIGRTFNLGPVNDAPTVVTKSVTIDNDAAATISVQASDIDDNLSKIIINTLPTKGILRHGTTVVSEGYDMNTGATRNSTINLTYTPNTDVTGTDSFTYTARDVSGALSDVATVTINLNPVVYPETQDVSASVYSDETVNIVLTGSDAATSVTGFRIKSVTSGGALFHGATQLSVGSLVNADIGGTATVTFDPSITQSGEVSFTFAAVSEIGKEDRTPATATITITRVYAPVTNGATLTIDQNTQGNFVISGTVTNSTVTGIKLTSAPTHGTIKQGATTLNVGDIAAATGESVLLTYVPNSSAFYGSDSLQVAAVSAIGREDESPASVSVTVTQVFPVAVSASASAPQDTELNFNLTGTISSGSIQSFTVLSLPANGTLYNGATPVTVNAVLAASGNSKALRFVPNAGWFGAASFTFTATSALGNVDATPATMSLSVIQDSASTWMNATSMTNNSADVAVTTDYWLYS